MDVTPAARRLAPGLRALIGVTLGFAYGVTLAMVAVAAAGAGHGVGTPLAVAGLPWSLAGLPGLALVPVVWGAAAWLAPRPGVRARRTFLVLMACHYVVAASGAFLTLHDDWSHPIPAARSWLVGFAALYAIGQAALWLTFVRSSSHSGS